MAGTRFPPDTAPHTPPLRRFGDRLLFLLAGALLGGVIVTALPTLAADLRAGPGSVTAPSDGSACEAHLRVPSATRGASGARPNDEWIQRAVRVAVAAKLGMTVDDMAALLASGQDIVAIASERHVGQVTLDATILAAAAAELDAATLVGSLTGREARAALDHIERALRAGDYAAIGLGAGVPDAPTAE